MDQILLGLGSNVGDRGNNLQQALMALEQWGVKLLRASSLYETEPVGILDQPHFLNMAVLVETEKSPEDLLLALQSVERALGRDRLRELRYGPRTIDIDILFFSDRVIELPGLTIPHPRLHERKFALEPLKEIAPQFFHPVLKKNLQALWEGCEDPSSVRKLS